MIGLQILQRRRKVAERYVQAFADIPVANVSDCMNRRPLAGPACAPCTRAAASAARPSP
jgi:hypothetical protein